MKFLERVGCITVIYWGYQIFCKVYKSYKTFFSSKSAVDLCSLGSWGVITCCPNGVGKTYAEALAKIGINIILISTNAEKIQVTADDIETIYNVRTKVIELNIRHDLESYGIIEKEIFGLDIGILINTLSMYYPHPEYFLDLPHKEKIYMNVIQCNVVVMTNMCRIILPQMVERGKGVIVNVASSSAVIPSPLLTVFAATKAYAVKFTKDLSIEYGKYGIIFQCLLPGSISNQMNECVTNGWFSPTPENYVNSAIQTIGKNNITTGYFLHELFVDFVKLLYTISSTMVVKAMTRIMESNRSCALRRYVG